ncbi:hypothetical protein XENTR_v10004745 [Xenopus tropicalis]|nr:hypothetical protein XENTR_v10004745 [Xenopus tropicalis]
MTAVCPHLVNKPFPNCIICRFSQWLLQCEFPVALLGCDCTGFHPAMHKVRFFKAEFYFPFVFDLRRNTASEERVRERESWVRRGLVNANSPAGVKQVQAGIPGLPLAEPCRYSHRSSGCGRKGSVWFVPPLPALGTHRPEAAGMGTQGQRWVPYILCAVLATVSAITVDTPNKIVEAARGKNATLPCTYQSVADKTGSIIGWKKFDTQDEVISYYSGGDRTYGDAYTGRVSFIGDPGVNNVGITMTQLTMQDNGTYQCEVIIPKDRKGTPTAKMDLVVLVAPTKPICGIEGTSEYGQDIKLKCNSVEGSPVPDYQWTSYNPQNAPRQLPLTSVREGSDLKLKNISADTSGYYICVSKNKVGEESCNITVVVMPRKDPPLRRIPLCTSCTVF